MDERLQASVPDHEGRSPDLFKRARTLTTGLAAVLLFASCTSNAESVVFESFTSSGVTYQFGTFPNGQGPDAPCVGFTVDGGDFVESQMACPTETDEEIEYVAALNFRGTGFLVGFGLEQDETIVMPDAVRVLSTEPVDGRRFFLIQLAETPSSEPFGVPVVKPDGTVRSIRRV